ncbi:MAG: helix-turn-helix domain-containing protein [Pseudomonadales bacterium]|nr:helix-turn-helix domain-containing protein [Pseudomonadales bacterium]
MAVKTSVSGRDQSPVANDAGKGLQSLGRALKVLALFTDDTSLGPRAVATRLELSPAVAHRILATLAENGFLEQNAVDRTYQLGWMVGQLGNAYYQTGHFHQSARQVLKELSIETGETAALHVLRGGYRVCLMQHESSKPLRYTMPLHESMPVTNGATDRVMRAFATELEVADICEVINKVLVGEEKPSLMDLDTPEQLQIDYDSVTEKQLEKIRQQRFELGLGLRESAVGSLATPIRFDTTLFVLTIFGPIHRIEALNQPEFLTRLVAAAAALEP